jgi:hypothetical protein
MDKIEIQAVAAGLPFMPEPAMMSADETQFLF